jgi:hypothetical protein
MWEDASYLTLKGFAWSSLTIWLTLEKCLVEDFLFLGEGKGQNHKFLFMSPRYYCQAFGYFLRKSSLSAHAWIAFGQLESDEDAVYTRLWAWRESKLAFKRFVGQANGIRANESNN